MVIFYIILAYLVGYVLAYILWKRNITEGNRAVALFMSCFSWIVVLMVATILLVLKISNILDKWHETK